MAESEESVIINSSNIVFELKPWTESDYRISKLQLYEELGGQIAYGYVEFWFRPDSDKAFQMITDETTGELVISDQKDGGLEMTIPIYIMSREFFLNTLKINFLCISDKKFITDPHSTEFTDISDALSSLYPGESFIDAETDINGDYKIFQACETDYEACTRCCYSFKSGAMFAYGFEGLTIKDVIGNKSNPIAEVVGEKLMFNTKPYELTYDTKINRTSFNGWTETEEKQSVTQKDYSENELTNCKVCMNFTDYIIHGTGYETFHKNYMHNKNLINAKMYSNLKITGNNIPGYKIGDVIKYYRASQNIEYPFTNYVVASNEIFYCSDGADSLSPHGYSFEWTSNLWGLDEGKWSQDEGE